MATKSETASTDTIWIDARFHGPPDSGNGGYVCGRLAQFLGVKTVAQLGDGGVVARLRIPPPLEKDLVVRDADVGVALFDGETLVAEARATDVRLEPPVAPSFAEATAAAAKFRGFESHWFPGCFVCGPERPAGDGLRIFPGPLAGRSDVACPWVPDASLEGKPGQVAPEFLWAALDCPGAFSFAEPGEGRILLGELQVQLAGEVAVGERCVLVAWEIAQDGRKHRTGTALFGESGACRGVALGTWIEIA